MPTRQIHRPGLGQRIRRMFLMPTGKRRAPRRTMDPDTTAITVAKIVIPPHPDLPPASSHDAAMRALKTRLSEQGLTVTGRTATRPAMQSLGHVQARVPRPRPAEPAPGPKPPVVPRPRPGKVLLRDAPTQPIPMVKVTALPTAYRIDDVPQRPELTPDEFLVTQGWQRLFDAATRITDVVAFSVRPDGTLRRVETSVSDGRSDADADPTPEQSAHLCKICRNLSSGEQLGPRTWKCDTCQNTSEY